MKIKKTYQWTDNKWPSDHGAKWTIALQSSIRLKQTTWKFGEIYVNVLKINFIWKKFCVDYPIACVHIYIFPNKKDSTPMLHKWMTSSWYCLCSTAGYFMIPLWFLVVWVKKTKTIASSCFHGKLNFSENQIFNHF